MSQSVATKRWPHARLAYILIVGLWVVYATLSLLAPQSANQRYHLDETHLLLLRLTIILPVHLIWLLAIRGAVTLKNYASIIRTGAEGPAVNSIADGLLWAIAYLVVPAVLAAALPFLEHSTILNPLIVVRDHLSPLIALVAFFLIYRGSHQLRIVADFQTWTRPAILLLAGYAAFAYLFVFEFAVSPVVDGSGTRATSITLVPHGVLLFTLVLPYLFAWFLGILATVNITKYSRTVKGVIYRQALTNIVRGVWSIVGFSVIIQALTFFSRYLTRLGFGQLLTIVYILIVLYGLGFVFIRSGANKLARIEAIE